MIPRYQRILFFLLSVAIILMGVFLFYERQQAHDRLAPLDDATPISAPAADSEESVTFYAANDADGTLTAVQRSAALPQEPTVRSRALLERLLADYALPNSKHPLAGGAAIDDIFLVDLPIGVSTGSASAAPADDGSYTTTRSSGQLAIINLRSSFVEAHPSGLIVELLTIRSMIATLHASFPQVVTVRFLVDGQPRDTLAGHAGLLRSYSTSDESIPSPAAAPTSPAAQP